MCPQDDLTGFGHDTTHPANRRDQLRHRVLGRGPRRRAPSSPTPVVSCPSIRRSHRPPHAPHRRSAPAVHSPAACSATTSTPSDETPRRSTTTLPRPSRRYSCVPGRAASRSESPSSDCNTITVAITSAGTDGRPRPDGNKSTNSSSGNNSRRCCATERVHRPGRNQMPTQRRRVEKLTIRITRALHPPSLNDPPPNREHYPELLSRLLASRQTTAPGCPLRAPGPPRVLDHLVARPSGRRLVGVRPTFVRRDRPELPAGHKALK